MTPPPPPRAGSFHPSVPYERVATEPFRSLPPETWSEELFLATELVEAVVAARCLRTLADLGIEPGRRLGSLRTGVDLAASARIAPDRRYAFDWILRRLAASGLLEGDPGGGRIDALRPGPWSDEDLAAAVQEAGAGLGSTVALIDRAARHYPAFLRGELGDTGNVTAVLFGRESLGLWEAYFTNANLAYAAMNVLGAAAADAATAGRAGLRVLEVGCGCGSGTEALLARVGPRIASYVATDISPAFLRRGRETVRERFPDLAERVSWKRLDLNAPVAEQGLAVPEGGFDLVYGVNALHVARDLVPSLRDLSSALRPGGAGVLALAECVRPARGYPVPIEYVFQLTAEFRTFEPEPGVREAGGFLHFADWPRAFERAGLADVRLLPADMEAAIAAYPAYCLSAIAGRRP